MYGAKVKSFDATKAKAIKGVKSVVAFETPVRSGVAVLAADFWTAKKAAELVTVAWDDSAAFKRSSASYSPSIVSLRSSLARRPSKVGDAVDRVRLGRADDRSHLRIPIPRACFDGAAELRRARGSGGWRGWNGEQFQTVDQAAIAKLLGLPPASVKLNQLYAGGSFGRRANPHSDYLVEAVAIAKAAGVSEPVKMVWTREVRYARGLLSADVRAHAQGGTRPERQAGCLAHRIVGQSILAGTAFAGPGLDASSTEGASTCRTTFPTCR